MFPVEFPFDQFRKTLMTKEYIPETRFADYFFDCNILPLMQHIATQPPCDADQFGQPLPHDGSVVFL